MFSRAAMGAACVALALAGCAPRLVPLRNQGAVLLQAPQSETDVRAAIARALQVRRFTSEGDEAGRISARFDRGAASLRVAVTYTGTQYAVQYVDSTGYNYAVGPEGPTISRSALRVMDDLRRSIDDELRRPAREAAAAAEAARRQEAEARQAAADERQRERDAEIERERIRAQAAQARADTARANADAARAQADANRPIIVGHAGVVGTRMAFNARGARGGRFGLMRLSTGFTPDPRVMNGTAQGNTGAIDLGMPNGCTGFYAGQPEHVIVLGTHVNYLRIESHANVDTTLAIVAPDGSTWCDDDGAGGTNARIAGEFPAGTYRVFVGSYQQGVVAPYQLHITEYQPGGGVAQPAQPAHVAQPAAPPDCRQALLAAGHNAVHMMHCDGAEPYCAEALLQAGHNPAHLIHCRGVQAQCAVTLLRSGRNPAQLIHCR